MRVRTTVPTRTIDFSSSNFFGIGTGWCSPECLSIRSQSLNFLTSNIREFNLFGVYSTTLWFPSYRKHSGSFDLRISPTCFAAGQNPPGVGRAFWGATSATSYTSFSAKGKAKSARSAVCGHIAFVFTSRMPKTEDAEDNEATKPAFIESPLHVPLCIPVYLCVLRGGDFFQPHEVEEKAGSLDPQHSPAFTPAAEALARNRAPFQASRRPPARLLLPMAVRRSAHQSEGHRPNTPSEPRRRGNPAG